MIIHALRTRTYLILPLPDARAARAAAATALRGALLTALAASVYGWGFREGRRAGLCAAAPASAPAAAPAEPAGKAEPAPSNGAPGSSHQGVHGVITPLNALDPAALVVTPAHLAPKPEPAPTTLKNFRGRLTPPPTF